MKVRDVMSTPVVTVHEDATLEEVARLMLERNIGGVPVVKADGRLTGIVTESDFSAKQEPVPFSLLRLPSVLGHWLQDPVERVYREARSIKAKAVMTVKVVTVSEDDPVELLAARGEARERPARPAGPRRRPPWRGAWGAGSRKSTAARTPRVPA
jgi:CBS-domain-containing membrane protein